MKTVQIGRLEEFEEGVARTFAAGKITLVAVRVGDEVHVLTDVCSHEKFPLHVGVVDVAECSIECDRHGAAFSLRDGSVLSLPATKPVRCFEVRNDNGNLEVVL